MKALEMTPAVPVVRFDQEHAFATTVLPARTIAAIDRLAPHRSKSGTYTVAADAASFTLDVAIGGAAPVATSAAYLPAWAGQTSRPVAPSMLVLDQAIHLAQDCLATRGGATFAQSTTHGGKPARGEVIKRIGRHYVATAPIAVDRRCADPVLYLGFMPAQFGHFLIDFVPRLWAIDWARRHGLKIVVMSDKPGGLLDHQRVMLEAAGVRADELWHIDSAARFDLLCKPNSLFDLHHGIHPGALAIFERIAAAVAPPPTAPAAERVYLSRRLWAKRRVMSNEAEVEAALAARGFRIVYPETLPLVEQIAAVRHARILVAPIGSQTYLSVFQAKPERLVILAPDTFTFADDAIIAAAQGARCHFVLGAGHDASQSPRNQDYAIDPTALDAALSD